MGKRKSNQTQQTYLESYKKIRQIWEINPKTKIVGSKKHYKRGRAKQQFLKELEENS